MDLLPDDLKAKLVAAGDDNRIVLARYFTPFSNWTWYALSATDYGDDVVFFGFVDGLFPEYGSFSLNEMKSCGPKIERDLFMHEGLTVDEYVKRDGNPEAIKMV